MNPIERWSPEQARMHPFITGEKWTKPFTVSSAADSSVSTVHFIDVPGAFTDKSTPASIFGERGSRPETSVWWTSAVAAKRPAGISGRSDI